jgi:hypothetical protein
MTDSPLHLVFGGKVKDPRQDEFVNLDELDIIGIYENYEQAKNAWKGASQAHVDDAMTKYVIVHMNKIINP